MIQIRMWWDSGVEGSAANGEYATMKRIIPLAVAFVATCGFSLAGPPDFFSEKAKDFGVSSRGPVLSHFFFVTNTSNQTVTMGQPRVSCG